MRIKLRRVGTSWGILIPKDIVEPFVEAGFIDVEFPTAPGKMYTVSEKKSAEIPEAPEATDPLGIKNFLASPTLETTATTIPEGEELTLVEDEIPEEYRHE